MSDDELKHHGVVGMKWGVRKPESIERLKRAGVRAKVKYDPARIIGEVNDKTARAGRNVLKAKRKLVEEGALKNPTPKNIERVLNQSSAHEARLRARGEAVRSKAASSLSIARAAKLGQRASFIDEKIARESTKREKIIKKYGGRNVSIIERPGSVLYVEPKAMAKKGSIGVGATAVGAATVAASGGSAAPASFITMATGTKITYDAVVSGIKNVPASKYSVYNKVELKEVERALDDLGISVSDIEDVERR